MPVTIKPSTHGANPLRDIKYANSKCGRVEEWSMVTSSFRPTGDKWSPLPDGEGVFASSNGLVMAAAAAYAQHHYLVIRPEDVWHATTTQLQFYINGHAEELRHLFVSHQGKQELKIEVVDPYDVPLIAKHFETLLEEKDKELKEFWNNICTQHHETMCGGSEYYSGWITAFCFWQPEGQRTEYHDLVDQKSRMRVDPVLYDGVTYNSVDIETVPSGFAKVLVTILPISGPSIEAAFLAGCGRSLQVLRRSNHKRAQGLGYGATAAGVVHVRREGGCL
ncbi:hypothetical protein PG989_012141 [Apiospora arundinis]